MSDSPGSLLALTAALLVAACSFGGGAAAPAPGEPEAAGAQVLIGDVAWYVDYDAALEIARAQDKALWVHFGENPG